MLTSRYYHDLPLRAADSDLPAEKGEQEGCFTVRSRENITLHETLFNQRWMAALSLVVTCSLPLKSTGDRDVQSTLCICRLLHYRLTVNGKRMSLGCVTSAAIKSCQLTLTGSHMHTLPRYPWCDLSYQC
ncbi:hypothetical protein PBY51_004927 [Eleginops maclovinus]|uniref:Uncharacterized protein n=1 Tax=Eleginops maclovinus TaxID=56733 RepID=A0AAN8ACB9_ELEMC|nr:hypothetical protein PBY51_004927 [Eleginops maclovinus]